MDPTGVIGAIGAVLGLAGLVGTVISFLSFNVRKTTRDLLEANNKALAERVDVVEREKADLERRMVASRAEAQQQIGEARGRIDHLENQVAMLKDLATGQTHMVAMTDLVTAHHTEVLGRLDRIADRIEQLERSHGA